MVEHYLKFFAIWGVQEKLARRDTTLWYHQILVESAQNILGVLSGLNRLHYTPFQFKRMSRFITQMEIVPEHLANRLEGLFHHAAPTAVNELKALVRETWLTDKNLEERQIPSNLWSASHMGSEHGKYLSSL